MPSAARSNRKTQIILSFIVDFLKNNPIHCTSYLTKTSIHWTELLFWIITLLSFIVFGFFSALDLVQDYNNRNAAITYTIDFMKLETFFPSLTLCPHDILNKTKLNAFSRKLAGELSAEPQSLSDFLWLLSRTTAKMSFAFENFKNGVPAQDYMQLIFNHGLDSNPYPENLADRFKRENLTYNFGNSFPIEEVVQHNIAGNITIYVHSPFEIPTTWSRSHLIVNGNDFKSFNLKIYIREINYDEHFLSETTPEVRRCRGINESNLQLFPSVYSRNLCLMECRAHYIWKLCSCIPHFYGNNYWNGYEVCDVYGLACFTKYLDGFRKINSYTQSKFLKCGHCAANCIEQLIAIKTFAIKSRSSNDSVNTIHHIIDYSPQHSYVRSAMYTHLDIIVGLSGVLSTFLGFSIYSLCDLIYFFTIRMYWFVRGHRGSVNELVF